MKLALIYEQLAAAVQEKGSDMNEELTRLAETGISAVQLNGDAQLDVKELNAQLGSCGMKVLALSSSYGWESDPEDGHGAAQVALAAELGAKFLVPDIGRYRADAPEDREQEYQNMQNGLLELVWLAGRSALTCVVQNSAEFASPLSDGPSIVRLLNDSYLLRAAFHTANPTLVQGDTMRLLKAVLPRTELVYLQDLAASGSIFEPCAPGEGEVPMDEILETLNSANYQGYCVLDLPTSTNYFELLERSIAWLE